MVPVKLWSTKLTREDQNSILRRMKPTSLNMQGKAVGIPYVDRILDSKLPFHWKGLSIEPYDGTTEPDEHVNIFSIQVSLYTDNDMVFCHVFPTLLKGQPRVGLPTCPLTPLLALICLLVSSMLSSLPADHTTSVL